MNGRWTMLIIFLVLTSCFFVLKRGFLFSEFTTDIICTSAMTPMKTNNKTVITAAIKPEGNHPKIKIGVHVSNSSGDLHLHPPSQGWVKEQLNKTLSLLGYTTHQPPNKWTGKTGGKSKHTYYFPKIKIIFTGIPKSGCSNWIEFLLRAEGALNITLDPRDVWKVHSIYSNPFRMSHNAVSRAANNASLEDEIFSFAVVRNPWTRLVSGYRDKLSSELTQGRSFGSMAHLISSEMNKIDNITSDPRHPTFNQYLRWLVDNLDRSNDHFTPQYEILYIPGATYDYILPLEYSNLLSHEIQNKIKTSTKLFGSYDHTSDPRNQTSTLRAKETLSQQDPKLIERLYRIFKADFALMNYSNFSHPDFPLPTQ